MFDPSDGITVDLSIWKLSIGIALVVFSFFMYRRTFPSVSASRRLLLGCIRAIGFLLLVLFALSPTIVSVTRETRRPLVLVLVDVSKSMSVEDCGGRSRIGAARMQLGRLVASLSEPTPAEVEIVPFSDGLSRGTVEPDSVPGAYGEGTDILGAVLAAQRRYRSGNLAAIVLMTDGRVTRGMTASSGDVSVPVYAVGFGDTLEGADVAIDELLYERVTYAGTKTTIEAVVRAAGFRGKRVTVQLLSRDSVVDTAGVDVETESQELGAFLSFIPQNPGDHTLTVRAVPLPGEQRGENNSETIRVKVLKSRLRFVYIDQYADWNVTFVRDLVSRTKRFEVDFVSWSPDGGFVLLPERTPWSFLGGATSIKGYDLAVVSDDAVHFSNDETIEACDQYVRAGGALLFVADEHSPLASARAVKELEPLLPLRAARNPSIRTGEYYARIAPGGGDDPVASSLSPGVNLEALPPLLARIDGVETTAGAHIALTINDGRQSWPLLAIQRHGDGLTAVLLAFPVWRWKLAGGEGEQAYDALLSGLIQYLAEGIEPAGIEVESDMTVYRAGDRIGLTVHAGRNRYIEGARGEVYCIERGGETLERTFLFEPVPRRQGLLRANLDPIPPGEYRVTATGSRDSGVGERGEVHFSVVPVSVEFLRTAMDISFLRRIVAASGGRLVDVSQLPQLHGVMSLREDTVERRTTRSFRDAPLFFLAIIAFFAAEWLLRKAWGMV